ncbi:hypothetical protein ABME00_16375 [Citrobacter amalonaticus]|uniref:hypothetical protein n=1 Tax=Citrobacter TaxID=544 RepID=UPI000F677718|nr:MULTISPECIES: hypothetical protein [Citrobacter]MDT7071460.1 hypothetical protein [Citrobacter amalonaticus]QMD63023.1 hypothetical protein HVZ37_15105 [Citrobacter sp. RHB35-C17]RSC60524.1 hypothetical protein EGW07_24070 [Citrobacter amalonaticus]HCW3112783.1 hypothetical protein [Citrobacter amalonaticus]HEM7866766.1 hypothetical protein [Citrobacter amalonaticus]
MLDLTKINKRNIENKNNNSTIGTVAVISSRSHVSAGVMTQIRVNGCHDIIQVNKFFNDIIDDKELTSSEYLIVDIEDFNDVDAIQQKIKYLFPAATKKIFIGDVDSITFSNEMKRIGAVYLHLDSQITLLGVTLKNFETDVTSVSYTQRISILGCKGGSGTSFVAYQFFRSICGLSHLPVLLVQGHTGTPDLDLISDTALQHDGVISYIDANRGMKIATDEEQWQFDSDEYKNYNIVVFDHNVTTQVRDKLAYIVPGSDFIFIVVTRELSSVRNARLIIDELERTTTTSDNQKKNSKNIIILNENHHSRPNELNKEDIENYLGKKIDIVHPYIKDVKKTDNKSELYFFTAKMLGKNMKGEKSDGNKKGLSLFSIFNKKKNN